MNHTPAQLRRLPKWAQEHIRTLKRERNAAAMRLEVYQNTQTKSKIWVDDLTCYDGTKTTRNYIQGEGVEILHQGVKLSVWLLDDEGIKLSWGPGESYNLGDIALVPTGYQQARLTNIVYDEHELARLIALKERENI
jgi:hypothetical protein